MNRPDPARAILGGILVGVPMPHLLVLLLTGLPMVHPLIDAGCLVVGGFLLWPTLSREWELRR